MLEKIHKKFKSLRLELKIIIVGLSVIILWMLSGVFTSFESRKNSTRGKSQAPIYETKPSTAKMHEIRVKMNGIVEAAKVIELKAERSGYVQEIVATEGDVLESGDVILILDSKNTMENLENAKFNVEKARVAYESALALFEKGLGSELKYFEAKSDLTRAEADLARAQMDAEDVNIKMPFSGVVDYIYVETGDLVESGQGGQDPVARVISDDYYKVITYVPDIHIHKVSVGKEAEVLIDSENSIFGRVITVSQVANENIKTFDAEVLIETDEHDLKTGMGVYVEIGVGEIKAHKIPLSAITLSDEGLPVVKFVQNNIVEEARIEFVDEEEDGIWISGIPDQTHIVMMGASNIKVGTDISEYENLSDEAFEEEES